jgi:ferredoxin-NADP reductase
MHGLEIALEVSGLIIPRERSLREYSISGAPDRPERDFAPRREMDSALLVSA